MMMKTGMLRLSLAPAIGVGMLAGVVAAVSLGTAGAVLAQTDTTAPTVSSLAVTSEADHSDDGAFLIGRNGQGTGAARPTGYYGIGDSIEVTVTFSENVTVTGSPQLELYVGASAKSAAYGSTDGAAVVFSYTVAEGDSDTDGISVSADALVLNGGSIQDAAQNDATLTHSALSTQADHKVDGVRPSLTNVRTAFGDAHAGLDEIYDAGGINIFGSQDDPDEMFFTFTSSEVLYFSVAGPAQLGLDIGGTTRMATYEKNNWGEFFIYEVQTGDLDTDGVSIAANSVRLNGGTIKDRAGNDAIVTHDAVAADPDFLVDAVAPTVSSIAITSDPGDDDAYASGDTIEVTVTFSENVLVPNILRSDMAGLRKPNLELDIGGTAQTAAYSSHTGAAVVFSYTVQSSDADSNGVSIGANKLSFNGGGIGDDVGESLTGVNLADLSHDAVADNSGHKVATQVGGL